MSARKIRSFDNNVTVSYTSNLPYEHTVSTTLYLTVDNKLDSIDIGITTPTPGANPDYRVKRIDHNRYSPAKYGLKGNGIFWYDSEGNVMEETDTFKAGETYQAEVKLVPGKDDYGNPLTFKSPLDSVLINFKDVTSNPDVTVYAGANAVYVYYNFTCVSTARDSEILEVEVAGVTLPEPGAKPDYTAVAVHPLNYRLSQYGTNRSGMYWTEEDSGNILGENDTFKEGKFYTLEIKLEVADLASSFQYPLVATIGGDPVDASDIYFSSKTVYLFARYFCGDEAVLEAGGYGGDYVNLLADMNDDEMVDSSDAIYLLYHVLFGQSRYPIYKSTDLNKSGTTDSADAIYLLYHTLFGNYRYPI